jgi:hypothetical protein
MNLPKLRLTIKNIIFFKIWHLLLKLRNQIRRLKLNPELFTPEFMEILSLSWSFSPHSIIVLEDTDALMGHYFSGSYESLFTPVAWSFNNYYTIPGSPCFILGLFPLLSSPAVGQLPHRIQKNKKMKNCWLIWLLHYANSSAERVTPYTTDII